MPLGSTHLGTAALFWGCALFHKSSREENHPFKSLCSQPMDRVPLKPEWKDPDLAYLHMLLCKSTYCFLSHGSRPAIPGCRRAPRSVPQWRRRLDYRGGHMRENRSELHIHSSSAGTWEKRDLTLHCQWGREEDNGEATMENAEIQCSSLYLDVFRDKQQNSVTTQTAACCMEES